MWDLAKPRNTIVIPINKVLKPNGELVMGAGVAEQARRRYEQLELYFGQQLSIGEEYVHIPMGNGVWLAGIPTKNHFKDKTTKEMLEKAIVYLEKVMYGTHGKTVCPLLGAGLGGLDSMYVFRKMREHFKSTDLIIPLTRKDYERIFTGRYDVGKTLRLSSRM